MNKKRLLIAAGLSFSIAVMIYLCYPGTIPAQECRFVKIQVKVSEPKSIMIEPETILVKKGDCVVWFNRVYESDIKIGFEDGKKCSDVTSVSREFSLDEKSCFVTSWVPFAGTSSLRFMEKGTYDYVVESTLKKGVKTKGKIIVE